ncbi:MAG: alanine--tRNA ligase [Gammaproteobacteria bacterium]|nr:alanine--tRNA ligase [Gammaproteobacteria bacterium]
MKSAELRQAFLDFFASQGHEVVPSSSLVPANDPTLLFTNAGMVQFKDAFLGRERREIPRAVSSQRCVRAGGKHNDLENVGYTARHHTFFEMLGNFSFGDYFKREAIAYAWEFVTGVLGLPPERLWVTVFRDDDEAARIWLEEIGVAPERFSRMGEKDNFWAMGDTGPCGPCSEIFYDHGPDVPGGPPGSPEEDGDRYVEIWNLVFMQYDRAADGTLTPLPAPSVDTGMGLERIAAVLQGVHSNYDIDLFVALRQAAARATGCDNLAAGSLRVIADHIRACAFLIIDGVLPSNEGRGYVLRRIIRRAIRHGYQLGCQAPFFHSLVATLAAEMGEAYPELLAQQAHVEKVLRQEEARFAETLSQGMALLEEAIAGLQGQVIPGETVFRLYDTYGFPADLTADIARERGLGIDEPGFETAMAAQRERARAASRFGAAQGAGPSIDLASEFTGYGRLEDDSEVVALYRGEAPVERLGAGEHGIVVLARTPFYAESGGQVGDQGELTDTAADAAAATRFRVDDTRRFGSAHGHVGQLDAGELRVGQRLHARVDAARRGATVLNHTATHLLHSALRRVLGEHVQQKGSLVAPERLRFDFSHYEPVSPAEVAEIERLVNAEIRRNAAAESLEMPYEEAIEAGALAFFGDKYGDRVRVLRVGEFSTELCGGTHVERAGDIGLFKIVAEGGVAAGVRRIEAVTGDGALAWVRANEEALGRVAGLVRASREDAEEKVRQALERTRQLEKELEKLRAKLATGQGRDLSEQAVDVGGVKVLAASIEGADARALRDAVDRLRDRLGSAVVVLGAVEDGKVRLAAGVTPDLVERVPAGRLVAGIAELVGGRGGGRADFAQAGGTQPEALPAALAAVSEHVRAHLT